MGCGLFDEEWVVTRFSFIHYLMNIDVFIHIVTFYHIPQFLSRRIFIIFYFFVSILIIISFTL
jgi:hypothetical protein